MKKLIALLIVSCFMVCTPGVFAADHPWQITSPDKESSVAFGILAQAQAEQIQSTTEYNDSKDLFLRRIRLIVGGNVTKKLSFFVETDSPNVGKGSTGSGTRTLPTMFLQDAFFTYEFRPEFQIDAGMLLIAQSHNAVQSAATLLSVDYGPYPAVSSYVTGPREGRDYGAQARGYLFNQHLEYRAGIFQGSRIASASMHPGTNNSFRYTGRVAWYPFQPDTGFFYTGTTLGTKKILSIGASFDHQTKYNERSIDIFYDQPVRGGDGITLQGDYSYFDGGTTFPELQRQHIWLVEAGYYHKRCKMGPFIQFSNQLFSDPLTGDSKKYMGGIAYWPSGHRFNVKLGIGRTLTGPSNQLFGPSRPVDPWQVVLQAQTFVF
jgi:hypothetical protein